MKRKKETRGKLCRMALLAAILLFSVGCGMTAGEQRNTESEYESREGYYFDTRIQLRIEAPQGRSGKEILEGCFSLCEKYEEIFSRTRKDSELYRINHRTEQSVEVSEEMAEVLQMGISCYEASKGAFDITIAPVLELWDFRSGKGTVPEAGKIREALEMVDGSKVHLTERTLTFDDPKLTIDLGALAKGYAADGLRAYLEAEGVRHALIDLGGNVVALGGKTDGSPWKVGIQIPFAERGTYGDVVEVTTGSVVSSGVYERYFEEDGVRYHHILDPRTGYPVETDLWQATVISDSSLLGDALSTTCMLLGAEEAEKLSGQYPQAEIRMIKAKNGGEQEERE